MGHTIRRSVRLGDLLATILACLLLVPASAAALDNGQCFDCHGDPGILSWSPADMASNVKPGGPAKAPRDIGPFPGISLHVDRDPYEASVHKDLSCTDCHGDIKELPHAARLAPVDCSGCHSEVARTYAASRHVAKHSVTTPHTDPRCPDCHGAHAIPKSSLSSSPVSYRNVAATCTRCHSSPKVTAGAGIALPGAGRMYEKSIHNLAIVNKGLNKSASCVDCHGAHDLKDRLDPASPIFRSNIPATCGKCHFGVFTIYKDSVHGTALARGVPDAPACSDCHGEHDIGRAQDAGSPTSVASVAQKACAACHAAEKLAARYNIPVGKVKGYEESFHGLSQKLGDREVANCASCHGTHEIFPSSDPRSTVNVKNLPVTCGKCHPGATANFAQGNIHVGLGGVGGTIKFYVEKFYIWMIILVIGGMVVHNGADYIRKMQAIYRQRREWDHPGFERLNRSERIQHVLTLTTFFALVITGFALKFKWAVPFLPDAMNVALRAQGHRLAAVLMTATSVYHLFYAVATARGRDQVARMLPRWQDARDVAAMLKYLAGLSGHKPKFGRYSYVEKAEYLALVWGTIVMVVTGCLLWFQDEALRHLPMWGLDVATIIHYYEAILATLAIFVWHIYYVIINPDFAPMSLTWLDGKLSRHHMEHEHPLELDEIERGEGREEAPEIGKTRIVTEEG